MTLYEVLLALAIMLVAMAILSGHIALGTRAAVEANLRTEAALLCESKLNEVLAGIEPMNDVQGAPFESSTGELLVLPVEGDWTWSLEVRPGVPHVDAVTIAVAVERLGTGYGHVRYTLRRIVRDPALFSEAATTDTAAEEP